jgi:YceI-like protein
MIMRTDPGWVAGTGRTTPSPTANEERRILRMPLAALALCACVLACSPVSTAAAESETATASWAMPLGAGSELWIEGTSTLHDWSSRTDSIGLVLRLAGGTAKPADAHGLEALIRAKSVHGVVADVPVHSLRSKESKLDRNLWRAMRTDEYPNVRFALSGYTLGPVRHGSDTLAVRAKGTLTICGRERPVELEALAHTDSGGLWFVGSEELLMTDYGIKPPTMMMGTIRVGNRIQVHYRLLLVPGAAGVPATPVGGDEKGAHR